MHILIRWSPVNGTPTADGRAEEVARSLKKQGPVPEVLAEEIPSTSSHLVIDWCRVLRKKGEISDLVVLYRGFRLVVNSEGRLPHWPKGFCDQTDEVLDQLIDW